MGDDTEQIVALDRLAGVRAADIPDAGPTDIRLQDAAAPLRNGHLDASKIRAGVDLSMRIFALVADRNGGPHVAHGAGRWTAARTTVDSDSRNGGPHLAGNDGSVSPREEPDRQQQAVED